MGEKRESSRARGRGGNLVQAEEKAEERIEKLLDDLTKNVQRLLRKHGYRANVEIDARGRSCRYSVSILTASQEEQKGIYQMWRTPGGREEFPKRVR
jgi:hypothetical protein